MKTVFASILAAGMLSTPTPIVGVMEAFACNSACQIAKFQASRKPFSHKIAATTGPMACGRLLATYMTEVVLVGGEDAETGPVISSLAANHGYAMRFGNQPEGTKDVLVREFCVDLERVRQAVKKYGALTWCNGLEPGDGKHHTLSMSDPAERPYLERFVETGHVGDFLTLLGKERSYNGPVPAFFTGKRYRQKFGG